MSINYEDVRFVIADNQELLDAVGRLRYEVYVKEYKFEDPSAHPTGIERDDYDQYSTHLAAVEKRDDGCHQVIGTVRLIHNSEKGYPIEHAVPEVFEQEMFYNKQLAPPLESTVEISRLALAKRFRRRLNDGLLGVESYLELNKQGEHGWIEDEHRKKPFIIIGLYRAMFRYAIDRKLTHFYMLTERALHYVSKRFGFVFTEIGKPIEYHGRNRIPYMASFSEIEKNLLEKHPEFLNELIREELISEKIFCELMNDVPRYIVSPFID